MLSGNQSLPVRLPGLGCVVVDVSGVYVAGNYITLGQGGRPCMSSCIRLLTGVTVGNVAGRRDAMRALSNRSQHARRLR